MRQDKQKDVYYKGFMAGMIGGVASTIWSRLSSYLGFSTLRLEDWAGILTLGHTPPFSLGEQLYSIIIHIGYAGFLGMLFAYLLTFIGSEKLLFKGATYAVASYFLLYVVTALFKVEGTMPLPLNTAISNLIGSSIYGVAMARSQNAVEGRRVSERKTMRNRRYFFSEFLPEPAAKKEEDDDDK